MRSTRSSDSGCGDLGNIDELRIVDVGGNGRGLEQLSSIVPNTAFKFIAALKSQEVDPKPFLSKLGIDIDETLKMVRASG